MTPFDQDFYLVLNVAVWARMAGLVTVCITFPRIWLPLFLLTFIMGYLQTTDVILNIYGLIDFWWRNVSFCAPSSIFLTLLLFNSVG